MTDSFDATPLSSSVRRVLPEWIDYNGHMNVAYYVLAIDKAMDDIFDELGMGVRLVRERGMGPMALVNQIHYLDELLEGQEFVCELQLLDADHKRMHYLVTMRHLTKGTIAATFEGLSINVDLEARRSTPYPDDIRNRLEALRAAHAGLPRPPQVGAAIGIRRG
ncbi:MAG TPA: thioesterase family protein [Paracoccaceae bacterium]|nr:thioesterase family protein [Paracoccaceae bacterium]